jgi:hypothetical protein
MKEDAARGRLDQLIDTGLKLHRTADSSTWGGREYIPDKRALHGWAASSRNLIASAVGRESEYYLAFADAIGTCSWADEMYPCIGILESLRQDWDAGLLVSRELLIAADAFEGFLEQADYLLSEHYKDAAAVLVGGVLESTLRKICDVHGVPYGPKDTIEPLNVALAKQTPPLYNKLVQKQITAWADLRNNAAHAHYDRYEEGNVADMLKWVREFAARHLA